MNRIVKDIYFMKNRDTFYAKTNTDCILDRDKYVYDHQYCQL